VIRLSLSLTLVISTLPTLALASPDTPQAALKAAPFTLILNAPCASSITIDGVQGQEGAVLVQEDSQTQAGLSLTTEGKTARLEGQSCDANTHLHVQPGTAIIATMARFSSLHLSGINGPLSLTQRSSGDVTVDQATALVLDEKGFGSLKLGWLNGPASLMLGSSGDVTIGRVDAPRLTASSTGFGNITLSNGRIGNLEARIHSSGNFSFGGIAQTATLEADSFGNIVIEEVTGRVRKQALRTGSITISHETEPHPRHETAPSLLTLPDGTVITAHNLVKPDGTVIAFDDTQSDNDETTDASERPHRRSHIFRWFMLLCAILFFVLRRRLAPYVSGITRPFGPATVQGNAPGDNQSQIMDLTERLRKLEKRVGEVEHCVTSRDFHLHRELNALSRRVG